MSVRGGASPGPWDSSIEFALGDDVNRVRCAGSAFWTGTAIARALVRYAETAAETGVAAHVVVLVRCSDGTTDRLSLHLGPTSRVTSMVELGPGDAELVDPELVAFLSRQTQRWRSTGDGKR